MARAKIISPRVPLHVFILEAQEEQLEKYKQLYGKTKTQLIEEALQFWLNEQARLYGERLEKLGGG